MSSSKTVKPEKPKRYQITPQEQADLGRRREMYQFENYKQKILLRGIEEEIDAYIMAIRKRLSIPDDVEVEVNLKESYIEVKEKEVKKQSESK